MNQTPIQKAIAKLTEIHGMIISTSRYAEGFAEGLSGAIEELKQLLPYEEEVMNKLDCQESKKIKELAINHLNNNRDINSSLSMEEKMDFEIQVEKLVEFGEIVVNNKINLLSLIDEKNDIEIVGNCSNCGVEYHIHKK